MELPDDVAGALVDGIGAYIRAIPASELPGRLRRYRSFRPGPLRQHRAQLLAVLDDDVERTRIAQWLDDEAPGLARRTRDLLRVATERPEGWEQQLAESSELEAGTPPRERRDLEAELRRERDKTRAARLEARRARDEKRTEVDRIRKRADALEREVGSLLSKVAALEQHLDQERAAAVRDRETGQRALRKAERAAERARRSRDEARAEARAARKEAARLAARVDDLEAAPRPVQTRTRAAEQRPPGRRRVLQVPKGLVDDDPKTLAAWLRAPHVSLLVDGYNVTKHESGYSELDLERQRDRLLDELERIARSRTVPVTVVFDGAHVPPGTARRSRRNVKVAYSKPPESADDHLVAVLEGMPTWPVVVVTNDRELRARLQPLGATFARSEQLLGLVRRRHADAPE